MDTTSHFIWIALQSEFLSDIFVRIYQYIKANHIEDTVIFQNPLSVHITLYYLEKHLDEEQKNSLKQYISLFDLGENIFICWYDYFGEKDNKKVLYCTSNTTLPLETYRNMLHEKYQRNDVDDNNFPFSPHITLLRIQESTVFEQHRENIENIIQEELYKIRNLNINTGKIFLYAVNSQFRDEIQIPI